MADKKNKSGKKGKRVGNPVTKSSAFPSEREFEVDQAKNIITRADAIRKNKPLMKDIKKRMIEERNAIDKALKKL